MKCDDIQALFPEYTDAPKQYPEVAEHLQLCDECRHDYADYQFLAEGLLTAFAPITSRESQKNQSAILARIARKNKLRRIWMSVASSAAVLVLTFSTLQLIQPGTPSLSLDMLSGDYAAELVADGTLELELSPSEDVILEYLVSSGDVDYALNYLNETMKN